MLFLRTSWALTKPKAGKERNALQACGMLQARTVSISCLFSRPRPCSLRGARGAAAWCFNAAVTTKISGTCLELSQV